MPTLRPVFEKDADGRMIFSGKYDALDSEGRILATGTLEVDVIDGAGGFTKTDVKFITDGRAE